MGHRHAFNPAGGLGLVQTYSLDDRASGGDPGASISEVDPDGQWSFVPCPGVVARRPVLVFRRALRYSVRTDSGSFPDGRLVVLFGDNGQIISAGVGVPPLNVWVERRVEFVEGS